MKTRYLALFILASFILPLRAQIAVGDWRTHLSYKQGNSVAVAGDLVYCIADGSLFSYRISDNSLETYSKINGLNDFDLSVVRYDESTQTVFLGYNNGNIDLLVNNQITNVPDIKIKTISGSKVVNNIKFDNGFAYLAMNFGIVKLDLEKGEIKETFNLSQGSTENIVYDVEIMGDTIYAATSLGVYYGLMSDNLIDQRNWKNLSSAPNATSPYFYLVNYNGYLIGSQGSDIDGSQKVYVLNALNNKQILSVSAIRNLSVHDDNLYVFASDKTYFYNTDFDLTQSFSAYIFSSDVEAETTASINDGAYYGNNTFFIADNASGLIKHEYQTQSTIFTPDGPEINTIRRISIDDNGKLRLIHGGESGWNSALIRSYISVFYNDSWDNITRYTNTELKGIRDNMDIAVDPRDPEHFFTTTYGYGVLEFQGETLVNHFDDSNSSLVNIIPGGNFIRTTGISYDSDYNLWVTNGQVDAPIGCYTSSGEWVNLKYTEIDNAGTVIYAHDRILVSEDGNKWVTVPHPRGYGIFVFNENGTIEDIDDDSRRLITVYAEDDDGGTTNFERYYDIEQDLDGTIWVGTEDGPILYYSPTTVFDGGSFPASRIKIPRNDGTGLADYLLSGEAIYTIAIDGGNRKWIGTESSGVFLLSSDGLTTIEHFTVDNSPLLSNTIIDIAIDPESGEVFIATNKGMVSYRSDATSGEENYDDLAVFPNPVRESYTGDIIIKGLIEESTVKITDISGNLVYETTSNGGTASWDGRNFYGKRVGTGVYLIFCSDELGEQSAMTKVLFVN